MSRLDHVAIRHHQIKVDCATHGLVTLTREEMWAQLFAPFPGPFRCPQCPAPPEEK